MNRSLLDPLEGGLRGEDAEVFPFVMRVLLFFLRKLSPRDSQEGELEANISLIEKECRGFRSWSCSGSEASSRALVEV